MDGGHLHADLRIHPLIAVGCQWWLTDVLRTICGLSRTARAPSAARSTHQTQDTVERTAFDEQEEADGLLELLLPFLTAAYARGREEGRADAGQADNYQSSSPP